jgi:hypothetical protein
MAAFFSPFSPSLAQFGGLTAVILVAIGFLAIGSLCAGRQRIAEGDLVYGWALVSASFTVFGMVGIGGFTALAVILGLLALVAAILAIRRDGRLGPAGAARLLLLGLPLLILGASMTATQWDELTNWLPNARYLVEYDFYPRTGQPASPSVFPAYPYGLPLVVFFASRLTTVFVENAGSLFNVLLYLSMGLFVARLVSETVQSRPDAHAPHRSSVSVNMGWGLCAFAGLVATALNPTYVSRLVFSNYADAPTAVTVGFAATLAWFMLNALSDGDEQGARSYAWQSGLALTAAIGLKQVNLVFLIAMMIGLSAVVLRDPTIRWAAFAKVLPRLIILPLVIYLTWRFYVSLHLSGGELSFRPLSGWFFVEIPDILARMLLVASKKGGYFGIMTVVVILALRVFWRPQTPYHRLLVITALMFLAYNGFLLLSYVAVFGKHDALRAGSYWRYNTHLGGVCLIVAAYSLALLWRRYVTRPLPQLTSAFAIILVLLLPLAMGKKLRFDLHPRYAYARTTAIDIASRLSPSDRLLLVDPIDDGQYLVIMRFWLHGSAAVAGEINSWTKPTAALIRKTLSTSKASHVWVYGATPAVLAGLSVPLAPNYSYLLGGKSGAWTIVAQWPHPPKRSK